MEMVHIAPHKRVFSLEKISIALFALLTSFFTLSVCSKTSFLYPVQDWCDANCFFTTGKSMANGLVLYKDIFEQKGILLYILHSIGYLISNTSFIGVFFIQVIFFTVFLVFAYKTSRLFTSKVISLIILPVLSVVLLTSNGYADGDSAEEFCLPFLAVGLFTLLKYFSGPHYKRIPLHIMFINGILAAAVLWIKYTILGFWIGFIIITILMCRNHNDKTYSIKCLGMFTLGGLALSSIFFAYFIATNSVYDMFETYFLINIFVYNYHPENGNIFMNLVNIFFQMLLGIVQSPAISLFSIFGIIMFSISKIGTYIFNKTFKSCLLLLFFLTLFFIYIGNCSWPYYYLATSVFTILGLVACPDLLATLSSNIKNKLEDKKISGRKRCKNFIIYPIVLFVCVTIAYVISPNSKYISVKKEETTQHVIGSIIMQKENSTLLNYGFLDGGFYTVTNKLPITKYFCKLNLPYEAYPQMLDEQNRIIQNKEVDFVVICTYKKQGLPTATQIPYLLDNYTLIKSCKSKTNYTGDYDLYALKELSGSLK